MILHSPWFPASCWLAGVIISGLCVEAYCGATHRRLISDVVWYLVINVPLFTFLLGALMAHFVWQKLSVYKEYRSQEKTTNEPENRIGN